MIHHISKVRWNGFTLVDLAVVISVIGILAGITTVGYAGWRKTTAENEVKNDLIQAGTAMESARNFGSGYPLTLPASFLPTTTVLVTYGSGDATKYCINGASKSVQDVRFYIASASGSNNPLGGSCP